MEIPLPIPLSVILSPNHIKNALPAVKDAVITTTFVKVRPPSKIPELPNPMAIAIDSMIARPIVK